MNPMSQVCPTCQMANADDANFCLSCSHRLSVVCERCSRRVISSARFCDRCGYALQEPERTDRGSETDVNRVARPIPAQEPSVPPPAAPENIRTETPEASPVQVARSADRPDALLERFVPAEMKRKLEAARSSGEMVGERRIVTMLFCDVKGSTYAAEGLDPEEWTEIINGAFEHMIGPIYTYEGTVARLMGDAILAFFGAPIAHEDDPHRAVLAGLDIIANFTPYRERIQREWGIDINVRVGINTGLVVVGTVGSDLRMEYSALGDAINLAARMEQTAEPGTVRIAQDTYKLVKPLFEFEDLGEIEIKGKGEAVKAYRVLGRSVESGRVRGIEGLHAEMVGRDVELQYLHDVVDDIKNRVGRIAVVLGEAGMGKTRLIREMRTYFDAVVGTEGSWHETSSLSYENKQPYGLLQRLIRTIAGIGYDDAPHQIQKKLAGIIDGFPDDQRERGLQVFETLFGVDDERNGAGLQLDEDAFKSELGVVMKTWWESRFPDRPAVFVFDDMHWGDRASVELLQKLLAQTETMPLALIGAMRVDRQSAAWEFRRIADDEHHHRFIEITLRPLSESDSNELVNRLLAIPEIPKSLRANIIEKSDGNPFFIEEVIRTLIDREIVAPEMREVDGEIRRFWVATRDSVDFSIPDNLQSLLSARMDRLEEATRATLQLASVIGRNFYLRVLKAVDVSSPELDRHVGTLLRLDLIREFARVPEIQYAFRNPLTQEAVYRTILLRHRREFHERVALAIEALYADRLENHFGLLAYHYSLAEKKEQAIHYRRQAARQAVGIFAYEEAVQNLHAALDLLGTEGDEEIRLGLAEEVADVCRLLRDFEGAIEYYQQALAVLTAADVPDVTTFKRVHRKLVNTATTAKWSVDAATYREMFATSRKSAADLEGLLERDDDDAVDGETVLALVALSLDAWRNLTPPDWTKAHAFAERAVELAETCGKAVLHSRALDALANVLDGQSLLRQHLEVAQRRYEITQAPAFRDRREQIDARRGIGAALMYVGEYEQAIPHLDEAHAMAVELQAPDQIANALGLKTQCFYRMDRWDDVLEIEKDWRDLDLRYTRERVGET
ncbi:MAG TPA: adenylate/guanylate cyclase domain-containing protein [Anaerolineales bacterium]|nr:adenylate/guanylate cyclase domain-containing protein [Anaerolineales bacterium]